MAWEERGKHGEVTTTLYAVGDGTEATRDAAERTASMAALGFAAARRFGEVAAASRLGMETKGYVARYL